VVAQKRANPTDLPARSPSSYPLQKLQQLRGVLLPKLHQLQKLQQDTSELLQFMQQPCAPFITDGG
jgi:hypothetical protein